VEAVKELVGIRAEAALTGSLDRVPWNMVDRPAAVDDLLTLAPDAGPA
jgi:hypothetical protein